MTTYVLVHGAGHGAWCWSRVIPELEARGGRALAVDLPTDDPSAGCRRYAEIVTEALAGVEDDIVLVGHSMGGLTIPIVAAARPVRRLVFLCATVPEPGRSWNDRSPGGPPLATPGYTGPQTLTNQPIIFDEATAREVLFHDCPPDLTEWAIPKLRTQTTTPHHEVCPLETWPDVESVYLVTREDRRINPDWQRWAARERLHAHMIELPGGHSPFLARPDQLAAILKML